MGPQVDHIFRYEWGRSISLPHHMHCYVMLSFFQSHLLHNSHATNQFVFFPSFNSLFLFFLSQYFISTLPPQYLIHTKKLKFFLPLQYYISTCLHSCLMCCCLIVYVVRVHETYIVSSLNG